MGFEKSPLPPGVRKRNPPTTHGSRSQQLALGLRFWLPGVVQAPCNQGEKEGPWAGPDSLSSSIRDF